MYMYMSSHVLLWLLLLDDFAFEARNASPHQGNMSWKIPDELECSLLKEQPCGLCRKGLNSFLPAHACVRHTLQHAALHDLRDVNLLGEVAEAAVRISLTSESSSSDLSARDRCFRPSAM